MNEENLVIEFDIHLHAWVPIHIWNFYDEKYDTYAFF